MITDIPDIITQMRDLYLADERPWIVGYSGGKDSTAVVQLTYNMLAGLRRRKKPYKTVHVVCNDTLVESPPVKVHMAKTLDLIAAGAKRDGLPIVTKITQPELKNRFFVKIIGRGYPAPTRVFRWCTDKLKIQPTNSYIKKQITDAGEVIIVLGTRRSESGLRARSIKRHEETNGDGLLRDHVNLKNAYIYSPIQELELNDIWVYLLQVPSPWGGTHRDLWNLYGKAGGRDCPLVLDPKTVPCGSGRFGCWTCTVVRNDKSMESLIDHGDDWMQPLLEFRDWLKLIREDHSMREQFRRNGQQKPGPFTLETRQLILRKLSEVEAQTGLSLLPADERAAIYQHWRDDGLHVETWPLKMSDSDNVDRSLLKSHVRG